MSVDLLRKQLAQTDGLTEAQLNSLLERLESQKARLPQEDHSIIDWGISTIQIRMRQREQLMDETRATLDQSCTDIIETLKKKPNQKDRYESFHTGLEEIIVAQGSSIGYDEEGGLKNCVSRLMKALADLSNMSKPDYERMCEYTATRFRGKADGFKDSIASPNNEQNKLLENSFRQASKDLHPGYVAPVVSQVAPEEQPLSFGQLPLSTGA